MTMFLRQSTAVDINIGPFLDSGSSWVPVTGLTISASDVRIKKNGGAWGPKALAGGGTHDEQGHYEVPLGTADTDTLGILWVSVTESGAVPVSLQFMVLPANVYDSLVLGTDVLHADVQQWVGGVPNALASGRVDSAVGAMSSGVVTAAAIASNAIGGDELSTSAIDKIADGVWDEVRSGHATSGTFGEGINAVSLSSGAVTATALDATAGAEIADAVWDEAKAGHVSAGTFGEGVTVNSLANDVISAASVAAAAGSKLADIIWRRSYSSIRASSFGDAVATRNPLWAIAKLINKVSLSGGTLTVTHENDSTTVFTQAATSAAGNPLTALDTDG